MVIVGGGQAGLGAAVALSKARPSNVPVEITLVDPKDYFEVRWAALRAFFDAQMRKDMQCTYESVLPKHSIVHTRARVTTVNKTSLTLNTGASLKFDVCLIAIGARCPVPGVDPTAHDPTLRRTQLAESGEALLNKSVVIIGGGTLGCELAGELIAPARNDGHRIGVVHSRGEVCPEMRPSGRKAVERKLRELGVSVNLNLQATKDEDGEWQVGDADEDMPKSRIAVPCIGYTPRNQALKAGDIPKALDERGWIETDDYFRVNGSEGRVFAFGDCCNTGAKNANTIFTNYSVLAHNLRVTLECLAIGKSPLELADSKLKKVKAPINVTVLSLGPKDGIADTPLGAYQSFLPPMKNKNMFVPRAKGFIS